MTAADVARRYGPIADHYDRLWAPPLVRFAQPLVSALAIRSSEQVVDLGAGTGAVAIVASPQAFALDRTEGMVRLAAARGLASAVCDARALPIRDASVDVVESTFVLQHIPTPGVVLREAYRVLRAGGRCGTATWTPEHGERGGAYDVLDEVLQGFDLPPEPPRMKTWHDRVDSPAKMRRHARTGGFESVDARVVPVSYQWSVGAFIEWMTSHGPTGRRIAGMEGVGKVVDALTSALQGASQQDLLWETQIVVMVATR